MFKCHCMWFLCLSLSLSACVSAPKPPECTGEFKPVNQLDTKGQKSLEAEKVVSCRKDMLNG